MSDQQVPKWILDPTAPIVTGPQFVPAPVPRGSAFDEASPRRTPAYATGDVEQKRQRILAELDTGMRYQFEQTWKRLTDEQRRGLVEVGVDDIIGWMTSPDRRTRHDMVPQPDPPPGPYGMGR